MDDISSRIYEERRKKRLSQEQLADLMELSNKAISKWENGESLPTIDNIVKLARIFNVSTDYLLGLEKKEEGNVSLSANADKTPVFQERSLSIDRTPGLVFLHLILPAVLLLLYAFPVFLSSNVYTVPYSIFVSATPSLVFFIFLVLVFVGHIAFELCAFLVPKIRKKDADQLFSLVFAIVELLFNTILYFVALMGWKYSAWNVILQILTLLVPVVAVALEIYFMIRRVRQSGKEGKPAQKMGLSSGLLFLLSLVVLVIYLAAPGWHVYTEKGAFQVEQNMQFFFPIPDNPVLFALGIFEIVLACLVPILFLIGFFNKALWQGKKFTIVQLSAFSLLNVLSSITMGLTFLFEKENTVMSLLFGGGFSFACEWALLVADIFFVVLPLRGSRTSRQS